MVRLVDDYVTNSEKFRQAGINVPKFDQITYNENSIDKPIWVHFGGGNLFRCFHADIAQQLLNINELNGGLVVAETYDSDVIDKIYHPYHNRFLKVVLKSDGTLDKELITSVSDSIYYNQANPDGWDKLTHIFEQKSLQLATFSITEKGYSLTDIDGNLTKMAQADIENGPDIPKTNMGAVAHLLYARYQKNQAPIAMVSTDNFSQNGYKLQQAVMTIVNGWLKRGFVEEGFIKYLNDRNKVTFPWSMIDRITPNPAEKVGQILSRSGFEDTDILHTDKHTNIAPFGNTEEVHYLVIEDDFPNGRPALEKAGVLMTDRETVNDADQMKVTACLNPLHTALAIFGCLLGYTSISDEVGNKDLFNLIKNLGYKEDLPVVKDPKVIDPKNFLDELLQKRLPNPNIPDTPQRIASDTSQKLAIRYGVTLKHYVDDPNKDPKNLTIIPLIIAGWCRYLIGIDDLGNEFTPSPDPLLKDLQKELDVLKMGSEMSDIHTCLQPILSNKNIFNVDLYEIGLGTKIENYFKQMMESKGSVIKTIQEAVGNLD